MIGWLLESMGIIGQVIGAVISTLTQFLILIYTIFNDFIRYIRDYVEFLFTNFPFDNPKKTLLLSIFLCFLVVSIIILFGGMQTLVYTHQDSSFSTDNIDENMLSVGSGTGKGTDNGTISGVDFLCTADSDCGIEGLDYFCCTPKDFNGRSCQGVCLSDPDYTRDYCNTPNACRWYEVTQNTNFIEFVKNPELLCINKENPQIYCSGKGYGYCNGDKYSVCYGYCMLEGRKVSIDNTPNDCINEDNVETILNEYQDGEIL